MDILSVIELFPCLANDYKLTLTIGKSISRQCFTINNKIFFDVLKTYLQKNGWFISKQYLSKQYFYEEHYLESITEQKKSNLLDLDIPVTQTAILYQKKNETIKKLKGTYFDIFCHGYNAEAAIETSEFSEKCEKIYNEITEEVTVFKKGNSNIQIIFSVSLGNEQPPLKVSLGNEQPCLGVNKEKESMVYSVKLSISSMNELDKEEFLEVFEIIELAMCKYKKTDKTVSSSFQQI
jgi:hypothetical protein